MALDLSFVFYLRANTFKYAFFKGYAQMVRTRPQGAFTDRKLARHLAVMGDLLVSFKQMIVENKRLFVRRQKSKAF